MTCVVCGGTDAALTTKDRNALPKGVAICPACVAAVGRREVGITRRADGTLRVIDGRPRDQG